MTMKNPSYVYPARLTIDEDGRILVEFPDFPFAATDGADMEDAMARDCLDEAIAACMDAGEPIPVPTVDEFEWMEDLGDDWGHAVMLPGTVIAAKAALYTALAEAGLTKVALASRLGVDEKLVRRMLDPRHVTKIDTLTGALAALGKSLVVTVRDTPAHKLVA